MSHVMMMDVGLWFVGVKLSVCGVGMYWEKEGYLT